MWPTPPGRRVPAITDTLYTAKFYTLLYTEPDLREAETKVLPKLLRLARQVHGTERETETRKAANELITKARGLLARTRRE